VVNVAERMVKCAEKACCGRDEVGSIVKREGPGFENHDEAHLDVRFRSSRDEPVDPDGDRKIDRSRPDAHRRRRRRRGTHPVTTITYDRLVHPHGHILRSDTRTGSK
jgi:hypothetical protein